MMEYLEKRPNQEELTRDVALNRASAPQQWFPQNESISADSHETEESAELLRYLHVLKAHWYLVLLAAFLGIFAGVFFSLKQTPVYRARTTLEVQSPNQTSITTTRSDFVRQEDVQTHIKLLQSSTLRARVVRKLRPGKVGEEASPPQGEEAEKSESTPDTTEIKPPPLPPQITPWQTILAFLRPSRPVPPEQRAFGMAVGTLRATAAREGRIIEITSDSTNPYVAARAANTLAAQYMEQKLEERWNTFQRTGEWLGRAHEELRAKLEKSEERLQEYARSSGLLFTAPDRSVAEEKLSQLQAELSRAQAERMAREAHYKSTMAKSQESLSEVLDSGPLGQYQVQLADLRRQMADLSSSLTPAHPKVVKLQAQINELQSTLARERSNVVGRIRNEYDSAVARERLLANSYASQTGLVSHQAEKAIQYNMLKREVDTNRQLYQATLQKGKEASVDSALQASSLRVIDPAVRPLFPFKPNHLQNLAIGLLAGAFLGAGFVLLREFLNRSIRAPGECAAFLSVPELGVIPASSFEKRGFVAAGLQRLLHWNGGSSSVHPGHENGQDPESVELVTWNQKPSLLAESFRATLASILFSQANGNKTQVIAITSSSPSEGKTTIVSNLSIALAEIGRRVVVVDADMRRPRQHKIFGQANSWGLSEVLQDSVPLMEYPSETLARKTDIPNLNVVVSGSGTGRAASLLHSARLSELLKRLRQEYDVVLIDSPPMLQLADSRVLGRLADGVILVIRSGRTHQKLAVASVQRFHSDGTRVLGTILNDWNPKTAGQSYYYNYSYANHYKSR
jgi:succinoglycan biosynthesis transport protein ExoP